jgi:GTPase SAR1 family protein
MLCPFLQTLDVEGRQVAIGVWDTAGSERYESMSRMYYRNAKECYNFYPT